MKCVCPVNPREPGDLVGCGTDFEAEPDAEGIVDCPHCGLWHTPQLEARAAPAVYSDDPPHVHPCTPGVGRSYFPRKETQ